MRWLLLAVVAAAVLLLCLSIFRTLKNINEANSCDMTFMYRSLLFKPIAKDENSPYTLIEYIEGGARSNRPGPRHPVLFIPGSSGSCKQVRSLATIMKNKTEMRRSNFNFDFFAVDFDEEHTFLSAGRLHRQVRFAAEAVEFIAQRYPGEKLILVGHSFGGVVAHAIAVEPKIHPLVSLILSLAAPLLKSPVPTSAAMDDFYTVWQNKWIHAAADQKIASLSISGGNRDFQVQDRLASFHSQSIIHLPSWSIPTVYKETDHLCILWCNQLTRYTSRVLFDYAEQLRQWETNSKAALKKFLEVKRNDVEIDAETAVTTRLIVGRALSETSTASKTRKISSSSEFVLVLAQDSEDANVYDEFGHQMPVASQGDFYAIASWTLIKLHETAILHSKSLRLFALNPTSHEVSLRDLLPSVSSMDNSNAVMLRLKLGLHFIIFKITFKPMCAQEVEARNTMLFASYESESFSKLAEWRDDVLVLRLAPIHTNDESVLVVAVIDPSCKGQLTYGVDWTASLFFLLRNDLPFLPAFIVLLILLLGVFDANNPSGLNLKRELCRSLGFLLVCINLTRVNLHLFETVMLCFIVTTILVFLGVIASMAVRVVASVNFSLSFTILLSCIICLLTAFSGHIAFVICLLCQLFVLARSRWEFLLTLLAGAISCVDLVFTPLSTPTEMRFPYWLVLFPNVLVFFCHQKTIHISFLLTLAFISFANLVLPSYPISFELLLITKAIDSFSHIFLFGFKRVVSDL